MLALLVTMPRLNTRVPLFVDQLPTLDETEMSWRAGEIATRLVTPVNVERPLLLIWMVKVRLLPTTTGSIEGVIATERSGAELISATKASEDPRLVMLRTPALTGKLVVAVVRPTT